MTRTAVVGAGYVGREVAARLAPDVVATTRSGRIDPPVGGDVPVRALDIVRDDPSTLATTLADVDALVLAYAPGRGGQDRRELYVGGTGRLLDALADRTLRRVILVGSTSALPDVDGVVDESCEQWPTSERGRVQREAEAAVIDRCTQRGWPWLVIRLGGIYGPGRAIGSRFAGRTIPGNGCAPTNLIHRDDAVAAIVAGVALAGDTSAILHACADDHRTRRELYAAAAAARGEPDPRWEQPVPPGGGVRGKRVANGRIKRVLGLTFQHPTHAI